MGKMYEKILVADDEKEIVSFIRDSLVKEGYEVIEAYDGEQAVKCAMQNPSLIILDVMMPGKDGHEVCKAIREKVTCPIIFLSALQAEADRIAGFVSGGDDYMTKPFSMKELKVRIDAHIRRERRASSGARAFLRFGNLSVDLTGREARFKSEIIPFTKKEFDILAFLASHSGMVFSKEQIYEKIWGYDAMGDSAAVAEHIKKIRSKLTSFEPDKEFITTVWGVGYKWERPK